MKLPSNFFFVGDEISYRYMDKLHAYVLRIFKIKKKEKRKKEDLHVLYL